MAKFKLPLIFAQVREGARPELLPPCAFQHALQKLYPCYLASPGRSANVVSLLGHVPKTLGVQSSASPGTSKVAVSAAPTSSRSASAAGRSNMKNFQEHLSVLSGSKPRLTVSQVIVKRINAVPSLVETPVFLSNAR